MEEKKKRGGRRPGSGRKKLPLAQRRLQRRIYCTQEELEWLEDQLDLRRIDRGEPVRSRRNDKIKKIIT